MTFPDSFVPTQVEFAYVCINSSFFYSVGKLLLLVHIGWTTIDNRKRKYESSTTLWQDPFYPEIMSQIRYSRISKLVSC